METQLAEAETDKAVSALEKERPTPTGRNSTSGGFALGTWPKEGRAKLFEKACCRRDDARR